MVDAGAIFFLGPRVKYLYRSQGLTLVSPERVASQPHTPKNRRVLRQVVSPSASNRYDPSNPSNQVTLRPLLHAPPRLTSPLHGPPPRGAVLLELQACDVRQLLARSGADLRFQAPTTVVPTGSVWDGALVPKEGPSNYKPSFYFKSGLKE